MELHYFDLLCIGCTSWLLYNKSTKIEVVRFERNNDLQRVSLRKFMQRTAKFYLRMSTQDA